MKEAHPNFIPHNVIFDKIEKSYIKSSLNVSESGIKKAFGSIRKIEDPWDAMAARRLLINRKVAQNNLMKSLTRNGETYGLNGFRPLQTSKSVMRKKELLTSLKDKTQLKEQLKLLKLDKKLDSKIKKNISSLKKEAISEYNKISKKIDITSEEIPIDLQKNFDKFNSIINKIENNFEASNLSKDVISGIKDEIYKIKTDRKNTWLEALKLSAKKPKSGETTINLFNDGIKETWVVPEDIAIAIKGTDVIPPTGILKALSTVNKIFKQLTTQLNPEFAIPNFARDRQTMMLTADSIIQEMAIRTKVTPKEVNLSSKELQELWAKEGGIGSNVYKDGDEAIFKELEKTGIVKFLKRRRCPVCTIGH